MYKLSKYNIMVEHKNDVLLYNTLNGVQSICKMPISYKENFLEFDETNFTEQQLKKLCKKGFIVFEEFDELNKLHSVAIDAINNDNLLSIIINPTEKCNFRCKYCYESYKNGAMTSEVQNTIINFIRHNINKYSGLFISWFGGEPLLALDVIENLTKSFKEICSKNKKTYKAGITTNGYLLDSRTFEKLLSMNVSDYQITLDGYKEVHDRQRVLLGDKPTFNTIYQNLLNIKQLKRQDFIIRLRVNFTVESFNNIEKVFDTISFADGDRRFLLSPHVVGNWLETIDNSLKESLLSNDAYLMILQKIYQSTTNFYIPFNYGIGDQLCYAFKKNSFHISSQGKIGKCTVSYEDDLHEVGKIRNGRFDPNLTYYNWIARFKCDYTECKFAPICLGFLCKVINKNNVCTRNVKVIEETLKIFDKNNKIRYIDG